MEESQDPKPPERAETLPQKLPSDNTGPQAPPTPRNLGLGLVSVTLFYLVLIFFTKPISWGDTGIYAPQIIEMTKGVLPQSRAWEFGHLIWRPLGELVWQAGRPIWAQFSHGSTVLELYATFSFLSIFFGFIAILAAFGIAWRVSRSVAISTFVACAFATWNAYLNYFQAGTSYVAGLAMQLLALFLI